VIGELEESFLRACPSFEAPLNRLREDHKLFGADLKLELATMLDQLGFHLGSTAKQIPTDAMVQVLKVVERVLMDGSEQQKWAVTHSLMKSLQDAIKAAGLRTDALLPRLGPATTTWWNDLKQNPAAAEKW
jgi:methanogenic corrinoid protein MtbC1